MQVSQPFPPWCRIITLEERTLLLELLDGQYQVGNLGLELCVQFTDSASNCHVCIAFLLLIASEFI